MGLRERFEKIANDIVYDAASIDDLLAAVCEEEGHKSRVVHTEQLGGGRFRDHFKCLRCGDLKVGPKGQKYPDGTVGYE